MNGVFSSASRAARSRAFTLIELLVVIGVIGVLLAIGLPVLDTAREASRRSGCANNLRQIGVALQLHHEHHGRFPVGGLEWRITNDTTKRQLSWCVFLLPFLEQQAIYDQLDLQRAFDSPENAPAASQVLSVFICPTSARGTQLVEGRGPCDYGGIYGERILSPNDPPKGSMLYDRALSAADIRDGLSNTLIVGEDTNWSDGQWINGRNLFDQAFAINAAPAFENDIRSDHPGGAQVLMASGSVRFLSADLALKPLAALCTRAGGEMIHADHLAGP
jgi:prepilin-type N-terminal cleavage/methylation domain-containing protein